MASMSWVRSRAVAALFAVVAAAAAVVVPPAPANASLADSLHAEVVCVSAPLSGSTWEAHFRVVNTSGGTFEVPFGISNFFAPSPPFRGQPFMFPPGWQSFSATFAENGHATWTLADQAVRADATSPRCESKVTDPVVAGIPVVGNVLAMAGERVDLEVAGYDVFYRWYADCDGTPVFRADGRSYTVLAADAGTRLGATITYSRGSTGLTISSACTDPVGVPPAATESPSITGLPRVGVALSLAGGTWSGTTPMTPGVAWEVCDTACVVAGTDATYTPDADDQGKTIRARVTRTNTFGSGHVTTAPVGPVRPAEAGPGSLVPALVSFPDTAVGDSAETTVHYLNTTLDPVDVAGITVSGADAEDFRVVGDDCPAAVPADGACAIRVAFEPTSVGTSTAQLHVADGAGASATLTGRAGAVPSPTTPPRISGTPAIGQPLTVTDGGWTGDPSVAITWEACTAAACGVVGAGQTFTPGADEVGDSIRAVVTATNEFGRERVVTAAVGPVAGPVTPPPPPPAPALLSLGAARLDLGKVPVRKPGRARTVQVANTGGSPLLVQSVAVSGKHRKDVVLATTCPGDTLAPGASCSVTLRLRPAAAGRRTATLVVTTTAGAQAVELTGQGVRKKR